MQHYFRQVPKPMHALIYFSVISGFSVHIIKLKIMHMHELHSQDCFVHLRSAHVIQMLLDPSNSH